MIYVLGSINIDLVMQANRFPDQGETLTGTHFFVNHGGKGANQAVACAKSRAEVTMIGCVGQDSFGHDMRQSLSFQGIDTRFIKLVDGSTGIASIWLTKSDNRILLYPGANHQLDESWIDRALDSAHQDDVLIVQLELPLTHVLHGLKRAKSKKMTTLLNPAPYQPLTEELLSYVDILCVNETEHAQLIQQGLAMKIPIQLHTLGKEGVECINQQTIFKVRGYHVKAIDTTAAGDTFIGAFMAEYIRYKDVLRAVQYGNAAAALCVMRLGAQSSIPTDDEIRKFMEEHAHD